MIRFSSTGPARSRTCTQASALARSTIRGWSDGSSAAGGGSSAAAAAPNWGKLPEPAAPRPAARPAAQPARATDATTGVGTSAADRLVGQRARDAAGSACWSRPAACPRRTGGTTRHRLRPPAPRPAVPPHRRARRALAPAPGKVSSVFSFTAAASALKRLAVSFGSRPKRAGVGAQEAERIGVAWELADPPGFQRFKVLRPDVQRRRHVLQRPADPLARGTQIGPRPRRIGRRRHPVRSPTTSCFGISPALDLRSCSTVGPHLRACCLSTSLQ